LDERKSKIIQHVVTDYVETCAPVGSKRIAERLGVSAATVRNDMHELIDAGYLEQPHTSAGRIPADLGYRFFVDALREEYQTAEEQGVSVRHSIDSIHFKLDQLLRQVSALLASWSDCLSFVAVPEEVKSEIRRLELTGVSEHALLIILVLSNGQVENKLVELPMPVDRFPVEWIAKRLNSRLSGMKIGEATQAALSDVFKDIKMQHDSLYQCLMGFFEELILNVGSRVFVQGSARLIRHPEFQEVGRLGPVLEVVESAEKESGIFTLNIPGGGTKVVIGRENAVESLRDCSIIKSQFLFGDRTVGTVGLLGPRRMNYSRLIGMVRSVSNVLTDVLERYSYV
jgi:heat-inducible transcriptional repressor